MATTLAVPEEIEEGRRPSADAANNWLRMPAKLPAGAMARPLSSAHPLPRGAMLRPVGPKDQGTRGPGDQGTGREKLTHPSGEVTGIDEATGLPIVRRKVEPFQPKPEKGAPDGVRDRSHHAPDVSRGTHAPDRPVIQGSTDPAEIRASATEQEPALRAMAHEAVKQVPGAKLEGSRVKDADSQQTKTERGKPAETNIDNLGARISVPSPSARARLIAHIQKRLPVVSKDKIGQNGLDLDQFGVRTGGAGAANQVSEIQVGLKPQIDAMKETEPLYQKQKEAEARGDTAEAARLGAQIAAAHEEAGNRKRGIGNDKPGHDGHKYKFGSTQANVPPASEAGLAIAAVRSKSEPEDLAGDGLEKEPHVTVRYGIEGEHTGDLRKFIESQKPFTVTLAKTASFKPSEHSDGAAPIVVLVDSPALRKLEAEMDKHGDFAERSFPEYKPHATLAYVKPEVSAKYEGVESTEGKKFLVTAITITDRDGGRQIVKLKGEVGGQPHGAVKAGDAVAFKDGRAGVVLFMQPPTNGVPARLRVRMADGQVQRSVRLQDVTPIATPEADPDSEWYGSDLDGTLAEYHGFEGLEKIGLPVGKSDPDSALNTVKRWIGEGKDVRILSARISHDPKGVGRAAIEAWTRQFVGKALPVTDTKDPRMVKLLDDRAVQVEENTGKLIGGRGALHEAGDAHRQTIGKPSSGP